jgi:hypothetical protein
LRREPSCLNGGIPNPENIFDIIIEKEKLRDKVCRKGIIGTMRAHAKQKEQRCKQR